MKKKVLFRDLEIKNLTENDFSKLLNLEQEIYTKEDEKLVQGQEIIKDIKKRNGLEYSILLLGKIDNRIEKEIIGDFIVIDYKTEKGEHCLYLEDISVLSEFRRQGFGWMMLRHFIEKLKNKVNKKSGGESVLFGMHLLKKSQAFMNKHAVDLEKLGVVLLDKHMIKDYYYKGADAEYRVYEIRIEI